MTIDKMWDIFKKAIVRVGEESVNYSCYEYNERVMMIKGIVVNKEKFKRLNKMPIKRMPIPQLNGIPYEPMEAVKIFSKPYLRGMRICYTEEQLREVLG